MLGKVARDMSPQQQETLIRDLTALECELLSFGFKKIGHLYREPDGSFVVGPYVPRYPEMWMRADGPWTSPADYIRSTPEWELKFMENNLQGWINYHESILYEGEKLIDTEMLKQFYRLIIALAGLIVDPDAPCGILHVDWDVLNIIMDKNDHSRIVGILD